VSVVLEAAIDSHGGVSEGDATPTCSLGAEPDAGGLYGSFHRMIVNREHFTYV